LLAAALALVGACDLTTGDDEWKPALLLSAAPQEVDSTGTTLTVVSAKIRVDDKNALYCVRLSAERGTLSLPGGVVPTPTVADAGTADAPRAPDGGADVAPPDGASLDGSATDGAADVRVAAPNEGASVATQFECADHCVSIELQGPLPGGAYAIYHPEGVARNDVIVGSLTRGPCLAQGGPAPIAFGRVELDVMPTGFMIVPVPVPVPVEAVDASAGDDAGSSPDAAPPVDAGGGGGDVAPEARLDQGGASETPPPVDAGNDAGVG
jgi:hypothetical protein